MQTYLKTRPVWIQLFLFMGMAMGLMLVVTFLGVAVYAGITGGDFSQLLDPDAWDYKNPSTIHTIRFMQTMQFLGFFLIPVLLFAYFSDPDPKEYLRLRKPPRNRYWILAVALMLIATPLVEYLGLLNRQIPFGAEMQRWIKAKEDDANKMISFMLRRHTPDQLFLNIIFIALTAGIGEELFFRGVLQRLFIRMFKSPWAGIILTALLFSAIHMQFFGFFPRFLMGVLLGAIYWYSGSMWVAILAHFAYDAFVITLVYFKPELAANPEAVVIDPSAMAVTAVISAVLSLLIVWQMKKFSTTSYAEIYKDDQKPKDEFSF
jgi:hypothetical protein